MRSLILIALCAGMVFCMTPALAKTAFDDYVTEPTTYHLGGAVALGEETFSVAGNDDFMMTRFTEFVVTEYPAHGEIYQPERGIFSYSPEYYYVGRDTFRYQICDLSSCSNTATVHITIDPGSLAGIHTAYFTPGNTPRVLNIADHPITIDYYPEEWWYVGANAPEHGSISGWAACMLSGSCDDNPTNPLLTYTPHHGFKGVDILTYDAIHEDHCEFFRWGSPGSVTFYVGVPMPLPGQGSMPGDPDRDGIYEDLNANGRLDFSDVVLYFQQIQWIKDNEPVGAFDLNGNGRIDFADVVALFGEV